jgi:hypothetical protein
MRNALYTARRGLGLSFLVMALVCVIWQPVLPSGWIIERMADSIDADAVPKGARWVVRFELSGKGGGNYNLVVQKGGVDVTRGEPDRVDLILYMEAAEFNELMLSLARGKADENTFRRLIIAKFLRFAGNMQILDWIFNGGSR